MAGGEGGVAGEAGASGEGDGATGAIGAVGGTGAQPSGGSGGTGAQPSAGTGAAGTGGGMGGSAGVSGAGFGGSGGGTAGTGAIGGDACAGVSCSGHGTCTDTSGSGVCSCDSGYARAPDDVTACIDIDEFAVNQGGCDSLTACTNLPGSRACGPCPAGYLGDGTSGCVPVECDGAPSPSCACVEVAPDGNDALGAVSGGSSPFQTVQAAIDFAAAHRDHARKVCVAAGASCGATYAYAPSGGEAFTLRDGISIYGKYEATTFTRCTDSVTTLSGGVAFGADIATPTAVDGFSVSGTVTARGAHGALVSDVKGADLDARDATLVARDSSVTTAYFENSPGSALDGSSASSVRLVGNVDGVALTDDTISGQGSASLVGVSVEACLGGFSLSHSSISVVLNTAPAGSSAIAMHVDGSCHATIDSNGITSTGGDGIDNVALECDAPCSVLGNSISVSKWTDNFNYHQWDPYPDRGEVLALACAGCEEVSRNSISTGVPQPPFYNVPGNYTVTAATIDGTGTLVARNSIFAGCADMAVGVNATGARLENNVIASGCSDGSFKSYLQHGIGLIAGSGADVNSNELVSLTQGNWDSARGLSSGLQLRGAGTTVRNNIVRGSPYALDGLGAVTENNDFDGQAFVYGPTNDADVFNTYPGAANNLFGLCVGGGGHLTRYSACTNAGSPVGAPAGDFDGDPRDSSPDIGPYEWSAVNDPCAGITCGDHSQCGVVSTSCTCDPGYVILDDPNVCKPDPCVQTPCDALTSCTRTSTGRTCSACPAGYTGSGETGCQDIDECAVNNGGCDPHTQCTNTPGSRTCGPCPDHYVGSGETGCSYTTACDPNPCEHGAACTPNQTDYSCACPPGITGERCEHAFTELLVGYPQGCGVRDDGALRCSAASFDDKPPGSVNSGSSGFTDACVIGIDGTLSCFGTNLYGEGSPPPGTYTAVDVGLTRSCAVRTDGTLVCFGSVNADPPSGTFSAVSVGFDTTCALATDGSLACFGENTSGEGTPPSGTFRHVSLGGHFACGVRSDRTLACWGDDSFGEATPPAGTFESVECGINSCCAIGSDGSITCWGDALPGVPTTGSFREIALGNLEFSNYSMSGTEACAIRDDDVVLCWGQNSWWPSPPTGGS
jgi:hypothetical protein